MCKCGKTHESVQFMFEKKEALKTLLSAENISPSMRRDLEAWLYSINDTIEAKVNAIA